MAVAWAKTAGEMVKGVSYAYDTTSIQTDDKCTLKYMKENAEADDGSYSFNWCQACRIFVYACACLNLVPRRM